MDRHREQSRCPVCRRYEEVLEVEPGVLQKAWGDQRPRYRRGHSGFDAVILDHYCSSGRKAFCQQLPTSIPMPSIFGFGEHHRPTVPGLQTRRWPRMPGTALWPARTLKLVGEGVWYSQRAMYQTYFKRAKELTLTVSNSKSPIL